MWTARFWKAIAERAVSTAAQAAVLALGADAVNALSVDWLDVAGFAAGGFTLSVLKGLAANAITGGDGPGLTGAETLGPRHRAQT